MEIDGSGALVVGGASGLGEATARSLHGHGARVVIADIDAARGEALAASLGERASFVAADVTRGRRSCSPRSTPPRRCRAACASASAAPGSATPSGWRAAAARTAPSPSSA